MLLVWRKIQGSILGTEQNGGEEESDDDDDDDDGGFYGYFHSCWKTKNWRRRRRGCLAII